MSREHRECILLAVKRPGNDPFQTSQVSFLVKPKYNTILQRKRDKKHEAPTPTKKKESKKKKNPQTLFAP